MADADLIPILKERYPFARAVELGFRANPLLAITKKDPNAGGEHDKIPVNVASNQAASQDFATAQTLSASKKTKFGAFLIECQENYGIARIGGKDIARTRNNKVAFFDKLQGEIDSVMQTVMEDTERSLLGDGTGFIGQGDGAWTVASTTLVLKYPWMAHRFQVGMEVGAAPNKTTNPRSGFATITSINRAEGKLITDSNWSAQISGITNSDYLFRAGDYLAADDELKIHGLDAWCPENAPTSGDNFFGVDRSADVERLAGTRYDGSGDNVDEAFVNAQSEGSMNGALPRIVITSPGNMRKLINILGAGKVQFGKVPWMGPDGPIGDLGFRSVVLHGDKTDIDVLSHPLQGDDHSKMIDPDLLTLISYGQYPGIISDDDNDKMRVYNANAVEIRVGGYPELATNRPDSIVRIKHPVA